MGDIRIIFDPATFTGDFAMDGADLAQGNELETAVLISLFTDALASAEDNLPPGQANDPRGCWIDTYTADQLGSKFWLVFYRQTIPDTLNWLRDTAQKALQWMIDDTPQVAQSIDITTQPFGKGSIKMGIVITEPSGQRTPLTYVWQQEV